MNAVLVDDKRFLQNKIGQKNEQGAFLGFLSKPFPYV